MSAVMEEKTFRGLREIAVLAFVATALFFLISLVTFSTEDAGWTHSGALQAVTNACGVFGAWLADFSLSFLGLVAYLFPIFILWHGYLFYTQGNLSSEKLTIAGHWLGTLATLAAGSALSTLYLLRIQVELPGSSGGIVGQEISDALLVVLGNSGTTIFLLVIFLSGITLTTRLSWLAVIDWVGKYTVFLVRAIFNSRTSLRLSLIHI